MRRKSFTCLSSASSWGSTLSLTAGTRCTKLIDATTRSGSVSRETWIGLPFRNAPPPRVAVNISSSAGAYTAPASISPLYMYAMEIVYSGMARMKLVVPSMGSITHMPSRLSVTPPSSP